MFFLFQNTLFLHEAPVTLSGGMQVQQCLKWECTVEGDTKSLLELGKEGIIPIQSNLIY